LSHLVSRFSFHINRPATRYFLETLQFIDFATSIHFQHAFD
jgi:hypothetical protein